MSNGNDDEHGGEHSSENTADAISFSVNLFHRTIDGIRALLETVAPHLEEESNRLQDALGRMSSKRQRIAALIFVLAMPNRSPVERPDDEQGEGAREPPAGTPDDLREPFDLAITGRLKEEELTALIDREFKDEAHLFADFAQEFHGTMYDPDKKSLLNSSMLVTTVAVFESLLARVLALQLRAFPNLLDASGRTFTLADLEEFDSVEDARQAAIEDRVDAIMRESFPDWEKWFTKHAGVTLSECCIDRDAVFEVIQRRHLLVHTGGRVSKQYLERLGRTEPPAGTPVGVDDDYLECALDELDVFGVTLGATLAVAWAPKAREKTIRQLNSIAFDLLKAGRLRAAQRMSEVGVTLGSGNAWVDTAMQVNTWIARKQQDGVDAIRAEIEGWDVSALAPEFELASASLLNDHDEAFRMLPRLISSGAIKIEDLSTWPLFRELRTDPRFDDLMRARSGVEAKDSEAAAADTAASDEEGSSRAKGLPQGHAVAPDKSAETPLGRGPDPPSEGSE